MNYTTQMNAARQGIITKEMEAVATYEGIDVKDLMAEVAAGTIVIPANKNHKCLKPFGIGNSLKTKINVNLGTSRDCLNLDVEMEKVNKAVEMGAEAIMDLSSFGHTHVFRKKLVNECPAILGTVPIYDAIVYYNKALKDITSREWIDVFKMHAEDGVDFMTIHCGINRNTADRFKAMKRKMNIVSRGGSLIFAWMEAVKCSGYFCYKNEKEYRQISNLLKRIRRETGYRYVIPQMKWKSNNLLPMTTGKALIFMSLNLLLEFIVVYKVLAVNTRKVKTLVYKTVALCTSGSIFANVFLRFLFPKHIKIIQIYSSDFVAYMIIVFLLCAGMIGLKEKRT